MRSDNETETVLRLSLREAAHLQAMEGNPLDDADLEMFEMFDREGWSDERRRAHILRQAQAMADVAVAK